VTALAWPLLARAVGFCVVAGYVDAIGYTELGGVFAANMTGNSVLMAIAAMRGEWARATSYGVTLAVFFAGAFVACVLRQRSRRPAVALVGAALVLFAAMFLRFDPWARLSLLALAMGLQGGSVLRFGTLSLQTVVVTGTMVRLADGLAARGLSAGGAGDSIRLDAAAWGAYVAGAGCAMAAAAVMTRPLLPAAALLIVLAFDVARDRPG